MLIPKKFLRVTLGLNFNPACCLKLKIGITTIDNYEIDNNMKQGTLEEFRKLYLDKFGIELPEEEVIAMAPDLVNLMEIFY